MLDDADALLVALRCGDQDAFRQIAERELSALYTIARGILGTAEDAEDACQEVLLRLHRAARGLPPDVSLHAWLRRVCVNYCLDERRRRKRRDLFGSLQSSQTPSQPEASIGGAAEQAVFRAALDRALSQLSARQRAVFVLRHFAGCSVKEAAAILGCAEGTVQAQLSRAVRRLRDLLREWNPLDSRCQEGEGT